MIREVIKNIYNGSKWVKLILSPFKRLFDFYRFHIVSDKKHVEHIFRKKFNYDIDLDNPQTLNEKIQWLKLYNRNPLLTICADKIAVRDYVRAVIGEKYLIPIFRVSESIDILYKKMMPNVPCIIKTNHDSGSYKIIYDKETENWNEIRKFFMKRLKNNAYYKSKEWQYKNIPPKLLVEKLLMTENKKPPLDYKFHCFGGKVKYIQVDFDRASDKHTRNWYDSEWRKAPFYWAAFLNGVETKPNNILLQKPDTLGEMIKVSEKLAKPFSYVRIDLYTLNEKVFFGEITFYHDSGFRPFVPMEWDRYLGDMVDLSNIKVT